QAGRVLQSTNASDRTYQVDETLSRYTGLGALMVSKRVRDSHDLIDAYTTDAFGNVRSQRRWKDTDLIGGVDTTDFGTERVLSRGTKPPAIDPDVPVQTVDSTFNDYDASGNVQLTLARSAYRSTNFPDTAWQYSWPA